MTYTPLKFLFDSDLAERICAKIELVTPHFQGMEFRAQVTQQVENLELKDRIEVFAHSLNACLEGSYEEKTATLLAILGPENPNDTGMFTNYYWIMPIAKFIEEYGLDNFDISMKAIYEITKRNTGEYAIRPFLRSCTSKTLDQMEEWSRDTNFHVRRLACEGLRPRLPWATKLQEFIDNPEQMIPILNNLKDDQSRYVQKSVGNCLNDVLKDNPDWGKSFIGSWSADSTKSRKWIIKHALRNLVKKNDDWAHNVLTHLSD